MDLDELSNFNIDQLLGSPTPFQDSLVVPYKQVPLTRINVGSKRSRLAERISHSDELIRQVKQLKAQNKQLIDLQRTAQEVTDLYQKEKQQRIELEKRCKQAQDKCEDLEKELDAQALNCENLQEELHVKGLPVDAKDVLSILMQLAQRLGDDCGLLRRHQNILKKLRDHCKAVNISPPTPKSPNPRNKRKSQQPGVNQSTQTDEEPTKATPVLCSVAVQVENLIETRDQGTQHKNTTTTRGTTTASFIKQHDVGTCFPEPKPLPNVRQILDEMLSWREDILIEPMSPLSDPQPELDIPATASVATCTTLCDIHREIDFISDLSAQIKVSASRPPSRTMLDSVKEETRTSRELAKELFNFLPQNQSCLTSLPPQAFEELWQVFGQMVLGLLHRRSNPSLATPPSVSQADFSSWLYELYEGTQSQTELTSDKNISKRDFATSTECIDVGTNPIIESPNISYGGDVTPIRLPSKPREPKRRSKKRKAGTEPKHILKRKCLEMEPVGLEKNTESEVEHEQKPETAIQFLSNLKSFNMANCDNLEMELDEEELYLLQLTSVSKKQDNDENMRDEVSKDSESLAENTELPLPGNNVKDCLSAVQKENVSSSKDDTANEENCNSQNKNNKSLSNKTQNSDVNTFKCPQTYTSWAEFSPIEAIPLHPSSYSSDVETNAMKENVLAEERIKPFSEKPDDLPERSDLVTSLFGSDSDIEYESSEDHIDSQFPESKDDSDDSDETNTNQRTKDLLFGSESDSDGEEEQVVNKLQDNEFELIVQKNQFDKLNTSESAPIEEVSESNTAKEPSLKELADKNEHEDDCQVNTVSIASPSLPDLVIVEPPLLTENSCPEVQTKENAQQTTYIATQSSSDESEDECSLVIDEAISTMQPEEKHSARKIPVKPRSQNEVKISSPPEVRFTRQRARQLLDEEKCNPVKGVSLVQQIRNQLKQAFIKSEPFNNDLKLDFNPTHEVREKASETHIELEAIEHTYAISEESPASPVPTSMDELTDPPTEIPLEQAVTSNEDGQYKSILQHVINAEKGVKKFNKMKRKSLGKSQPQLCASIGKYLRDTIQLESTCSDLALEIYKVTKDENVIVNAMVTVICKIGTEENPVERLMTALKYFNFSQRFMAELEERLFRNVKERPNAELALKYVKLYLKAVSLQANMSVGYVNPARLLLAKILYHFDRDMPPLALELLCQFPTVLPHREQREYDNSDPLITVIKHLLMSRQYDMHDPEGPERLLLSKLRFEYHFQPFEPTSHQVLENLVGKLKAGRLEELGYAFALFCRRSANLKVFDTVLGEHLMPLAISSCDLAAENDSYDDRLVLLLHCISVVLKPLPKQTDISAFIGFLKRLLVAVPRSGVQLAAVQAGLRLQRFGFKYTLDVLKEYRPNYQLDPLTRAMLRCFVERRKNLRNVAAAGRSSKV
ncbi:little elongation complex subunit 1 [Drosophila eugracilis]|uniref:little elongation complex subunit 1 n=1 Tax=Drosophila eugracilis TaxID=29029 RepID=UPI0007E6B919|nr:little elongation complex subunit 1 [Drosophila eugracilis]